MGFVKLQNYLKTKNGRILRNSFGGFQKWLRFVNKITNMKMGMVLKNWFWESPKWVHFVKTKMCPNLKTGGFCKQNNFNTKSISILYYFCIYKNHLFSYSFHYGISKQNQPVFIFQLIYWKHIHTTFAKYRGRIFLHLTKFGKNRGKFLYIWHFFFI